MEELTQKLREYIKSISKIYLIGEICDNVFEDFPTNLPESVNEKWRKKTKKIIFKDGKASLDFDDYGFLGILLNVIPGKEEKSDFQQVILRQDLVNYLAYLEAVMQDLQRCIYKNNPTLLPEEKEIKLKDIVNKSTMDEMLNYLIEKQLEKSGYDKITNQIERLNNKPFLLKISIKKNEINELNTFIAIRNLILHNGSRITNEYLELDKKSKYKIGDVICLERKKINELFLYVEKVAVEIFASICKEFYNIEKQNTYNEMSYTPRNL